MRFIVLERRLRVLPALPRLHPVVEGALRSHDTPASRKKQNTSPQYPHGSEQPDVIGDEFGEAEGVVGGLVLVQLLHLVLHLRQLRERPGQGVRCNRSDRFLAELTTSDSFILMVILLTASVALELSDIRVLEKRRSADEESSLPTFIFVIPVRHNDQQAFLQLSESTSQKLRHRRETATSAYPECSSLAAAAR
ncbi:hypothetical protein EYF80_009891 [Liparis tanakae]|uniref:Uncharacterized protein n=1 Tax=Liparis tanakae TaxID=230148 RepID=A0A4Z2IQQ5_9TELE|nr:hypothetical protein EYF80_009891 [Liparis tanakae]